MVSLSGWSSYDLHPAAVGTTLYDRLAAGLFGDRSALGAIVVPQSTQHLASDHLTHVHADQSHDKHSVTA